MNARQRKKVLSAGEHGGHRRVTRMRADPTYRAWIENRVDLDRDFFSGMVAAALRQAVCPREDELPPWQTRPGGIRYRGN